ncbi:MAG: hypothetical protein OXE48_01495 [Gammaproteobacteria bacterium]|nr:hypothetical protein [Gammaproteobacteria bacterium]
MSNDPVISAIQTETHQKHDTRRGLLVAIGRELDRPVVAFFTSFRFPVALDDQDVQMLEDLLRTLDLSKGLAVMVSSPGGSGLAAERIIRVLRSYSGTGEYWAIVPGQAKSAATMICLGASRILMGPAAELGPIDPQQIVRGKFVSVHHVIDSYHKLFQGAAQSDGNLEPYLQQLSNYEASEISHLEAERDLAADMAVRCLQSGMMVGADAADIKRKMQIFLQPQATKSHARPIYHDEAKRCGLNVEVCDSRSDLWNNVYGFSVRASEYVGRHAAKAIETAEAAFHMPVPISNDED